MIALSIGLATVSACQKKDSDAHDKSKLSITISNPTEGHIFKKGDTVWISARVAYGSELHGYAYQVKNEANAQVYLDRDAHVHDSVFSINTYWVDTLSSSAPLRFDLTVETDHDGGAETRSVRFNTTN